VETVAQDFQTVPVELVSFTGSVERNDVHLLWVTAIEVDNQGFQIERRQSGSKAWERIGFVKSRTSSAGVTEYEYIDRGLLPGRYEYRLRQLDTDGSFREYGSVVATVGLPESFALMQSFPNPFNPTTEIQYQIPATGGNSSGKTRTILKVYNLLGQEVRTLVDKEEPPGFYTVFWDATDDAGREVPSGVYVYRIQSGNFVSARKAVFVK
ncbi:MAG: T9SS C-terminal target domain-containing protein, partial [Calditrichaeota bacterium]